VECGVGQSNFELGSLSLENLEIQTGVGETTVELLGDWKKDLHASIKGGIGKATLRLPGHVGVRVESDKGIGSVSASGLKKEGNAYTNDAYGKTKVTLNMHVQAGIGEIQLELVD
jgi:predicted membrane protein